MLPAETPYSFYLCDWHVTVEWERRPRKKTCRVTLSVHDPKVPLHGSDISIALLGEESTLLPALNPGVDFAPLISVVWAGQETQYKVVQFGADDGDPVLLQVSIRGHRANIALGGKTTKAKGKDDSGKAAKSSKEPGGGKDGDGKDSDGGNGKKAPPPGPKCCVDQFNTPNGALPTTTIAIPGGSTFQCQPWVITAAFGNTAPCRCTCCEYRQMVRGTMTATPPGAGAAAVDISPITDFTPAAGAAPPGAPPPAPVPVHGLNAGGFIEDSVGDPANPGNPSRYGPRAQAGDGTQDYPTPCSYWGLDSPAVRGIAAGVRVQVAVDFRGLIVDTCDGGSTTTGPNNWNWHFNQVA